MAYHTVEGMFFPFLLGPPTCNPNLKSSNLRLWCDKRSRFMGTAQFGIDGIRGRGRGLGIRLELDDIMCGQCNLNAARS